MTERITGEQFRAAGGVGDWHLVPDTAQDTVQVVFRTGDFATGLALVDEIGRLAEASNHHPDIDLRYPTVTVTLATHSVGGLSDKDVALARQVSAAAAERGIGTAPATD